MLRQRVPAAEPGLTAEYLARMYLTYLGHAGPWDLTDPRQVSQLVQTQFIGGIVRPAAD